MNRVLRTAWERLSKARAYSIARDSVFDIFLGNWLPLLLVVLKDQLLLWASILLFVRLIDFVSTPEECVRACFVFQKSCCGAAWSFVFQAAWLLPAVFLGGFAGSLTNRTGVLRASGFAAVVLVFTAEILLLRLGAGWGIVIAAPPALFVVMFWSYRAALAVRRSRQRER